MDKWLNSVAIVTGAGAGIGRAIAYELVKHGLHVVALDTNIESLKEQALNLTDSKTGGKLYPLHADLRKEGDIIEAFEWVFRTLGGADILVNNAGVCHGSLIIDGITSDWRDMLEINTLAVAICTREYLKAMERRLSDRGHIIMINTVAAHVTGIAYPRGVMYVASKAAVKAITMSLRKELADKDSKIKVTSISPGRVNTSILGGKGPEGSQVVAMLDPTDVAAAVLNVLATSKVTQICEVIMTPIPTKLTMY